ncbi:Methyltransferase domain-containing protein [Actinacidiphila yanglinensis]|uniref:Methyltransferase domain-containing protein n=1 Tax=Actinacidiphila yanglinensis TaxID=310779 RepID=A0A1H6DYG7_9ACTN|nr:class I SAM-dependent methyltransferase [Actinacidiphila yanglinensis]SEG89655.1 Methyltransferase domain-containing protein [Actinacidiphila yanglinensis]
MADHQHDPQQQHAAHPHEHGHGHSGGHGAHAEDGADEAALADLLDLDAEVLAEHLSDVTAWIAGSAGDPAPRRIVDVGSGTGTGTLALMRRFEGAEVTALDRSTHLLGRLRERAGELGVGSRIRTVEADLDETWPDVGPADLVWASSSLHHMADPDRALAEAAALLRPGGLLAVVEMDSLPRFLPDDIGLGRPGLEARVQAAMDERRAEDMPHFGGDWAARFTAAGFTVRAERHFVVDLDTPPPATARYAHAVLSRSRDGLGDRLDADDLAVLGTLLDGDGPEALLRRTDLTVRTSRQAWLSERG